MLAPQLGVRRGKKSITVSSLKPPLMLSCYRTLKEKRWDWERPTGGKNILCMKPFAWSASVSQCFSAKSRQTHGNRTACSKETLLYHLPNGLGKGLVKTLILWSYIKSTISIPSSPKALVCVEEISLHIPQKDRTTSLLFSWQIFC